ncbi:MAG: hypothetical protein ACT4NV_06610 [Rhodoferax sp.]
MRVFLALLLCFVFAFQGGGSVHAYPLPCPMDHGGSPSMGVDDAAQALGDCCNDAETAAKTGKLCKTDTPCGSSSALALGALPAPMHFASATDPAMALAVRMASTDPSGVWRPPSLR